MIEHLCTKFISTKLRDIGFDDDCFGCYYTTDATKRLFSELGLANLSNSDIDNDDKIECTAPLWQQAVDFLERRGYYIMVGRVFQFGPKPMKIKGWRVEVSTADPEETLDSSAYYADRTYPFKHEALLQGLITALDLAKKDFERNAKREY